MKFPFKNMETISSAVETNSDGIHTFAIVKAGGSCFSDTTEVMSMLCYLTNRYGKLERKGENTWRRINGTPDFFSNNLRFRSKYLVELEEKLAFFDEEWKSVEELTTNLSIDKIELVYMLEFFEKISRRGKFNRKGTNSEWFMKKWNKKD